MALYEYACDTCGRFTVRRTIGTAPDRHACPSCAGMAARAFSPPALGLTPRALRDLRSREERCRQEPAVVTRGPAGPGRPPRPPASPAPGRR